MTIAALWDDTRTILAAGVTDRTISVVSTRFGDRIAIIAGLTKVDHTVATDGGPLVRYGTNETEAYRVSATDWREVATIRNTYIPGTASPGTAA